MKTAILTSQQIESIVATATQTGVERGIQWAMRNLKTGNTSPLWSMRQIQKKYGYSEKVHNIIAKIGVRSGGVVKIDESEFSKYFNN